MFEFASWTTNKFRPSFCKREASDAAIRISIECGVTGLWWSLQRAGEDSAVPYWPPAALRDCWSGTVIEDTPRDVCLDRFFVENAGGPGLHHHRRRWWWWWCVCGLQRVSAGHFFPGFLFPQRLIQASQRTRLWKWLVFSHRCVFVVCFFVCFCLVLPPATTIFPALLALDGVAVATGPLLDWQSGIH